MVIPSDLQDGLFTWDWTATDKISLCSLFHSPSLSLHYSNSLPYISRSIISGLETCIIRVKPLHSALQIKVVITDLDRFSFCMKTPAEGGGHVSAAAKAISGQCLMMDCLLKDIGVHYLKPTERIWHATSREKWLSVLQGSKRAVRSPTEMAGKRNIIQN